MLHLLAVAPPGLEREAARELRALGGGVGKTKYSNGRIHFEGPPDALYRCNLSLRTVERILVELGKCTARTPAALTDRISEFAWGTWLPRRRPLRIVSSAKGCKLYHTGAVEDAVLAGLAQAGLGTDQEAIGASLPPAETQPLTVDVRGTRDDWIFSIDSTGRELHRRGYRKQGGAAPLRETIAAALLYLAGWDGSRPLLDPMCGSGTFLVEAAWIAQQRAPGLSRSFAFEQFANFDAARWNELLQVARQRIDAEAGGVVISGSDRSDKAVRNARNNLDRARLGERVSLTHQALEDLSCDSGPAGLVVLNPPYDKRLRSSSKADGNEVAVWRKWGQAVRDLRPGWDVLVLSPDQEKVEAFGRGPRQLARFSHGGIRVGAWLFSGT